jgi:hypothetical protein
MYLVRKFYSPDPDGSAGGNTEPEKKQEKQPAKKPEETDNVALAKALKETRENSVSKEEYEKLQKENKELVAQIINGEGGAGNGQTITPEKADIKALREKLYGAKSNELSNLEFCKTTLELRNAVIAQEGYDPFLPYGEKIKPTAQDIEKADAVAKVFQECIDEAKGDSEIFTALLQSKTNNDSPSFLAHLKSIGAFKK